MLKIFLEKKLAIKIKVIYDTNRNDYDLNKGFTICD